MPTAEPLPFDTTQITSATNRSQPQPGDPCHPLAREGHAPAIAGQVVGFQSSLGSRGGDVFADVSPTMRIGKRSVEGAGNPPAVAFDAYNQTITGSVTQTLCSRGDMGGNKHLVPALVAPPMAVRRLTPRECERLQGFPDDWTAITYRGKPAADGPRYKALGNSMATNVMRWIGLRIAAVEGGTHEVR